MRLYHGTDLDTAKRLVAGDPIDLAKSAALKIDGPPGFFLASERADAEFFALRRSPLPGAIVVFDLSHLAMQTMLSTGAVLQPIPRGPKSPWFLGDELVVPPVAVDAFNQLLRSGDILVAPAQ